MSSATARIVVGIVLLTLLLAGVVLGFILFGWWINHFA
jgi:hypothetical protein